MLGLLLLLSCFATVVQIGQAGTVQGCDSASDCNYQACLTWPGYSVSKVECGLDNALTQYDFHCRHSRVFLVQGDVFFVYTTEWQPCGAGPCVAGKYKVVGAVRDTCEPCPLGQYSANPGESGCSLCPAGKFTNATGGTICQNCEAGTYGNGTGKTSMDDACVECADGSYNSQTGVSTCQNCDIQPLLSVLYYKARCNASHPPVLDSCSACASEARACTLTEDAQCGGVDCTAGILGTQPNYSEWMSAKYKCKLGQYLRGFTSDTEEGKDCRQCPPGMVGRNGQYCEWCAGDLEEPYWLDQSLCVCKPSAVMDSAGACVCPDGRRYNSSRKECEDCPLNTYGRKGECFACGAGNYSVGLGATACVQCGVGKYRLEGNRTCQECREGAGHYAPNTTSSKCVACNLSCTGEVGWRESGVCPGALGAGYKVCVRCEFELPSNARWIGQGGGCVYECDAGYYRDGGGGQGCAKCSTEPCPAGYTGSACGVDQDRTCEDECRNESKPAFYSKWIPAPAGGAAGQCPWGCEDGYEAVMSDYWMFSIHECVRISN